MITQYLRTTRALSQLHLMHNVIYNVISQTRLSGNLAVGSNSAYMHICVVLRLCNLFHLDVHQGMRYLALCVSPQHTHIRTGFPDRLGFTVAHPHTLFQTWHAEPKSATCAPGNHDHHYS